MARWSLVELLSLGDALLKANPEEPFQSLSKGFGMSNDVHESFD